MKILLVQLASMGDCLFVTAIARQIKEVDYPGCHLSWMIGRQYKSLLVNNPYVDKVIDIPAGRDDRNKIPSFIASLDDCFDKVIVTDFFEDNYKCFYGTTRTAFFRTYGHEMNVPVEPLIFLTEAEVKNVALFVKKHQLDHAECYPILVEFSPQSRQSDMDFSMAKRIALDLSGKHPQVKFIFSSNEKISAPSANIVDASVLSWRENAELTRYCKLLLGGSSGITWLNTSNWAAKIPMVQFVRSQYMWGVLSPSVELDFMYWGLSTDRLIEITDGTEAQLIDCLDHILSDSFEAARMSRPGRESMSREEIDHYFAGNLAHAFFSLPTQNQCYELFTDPIVCKIASPTSFVLRNVKAMIKSNRYTHKLFRGLKRMLVN